MLKFKKTKSHQEASPDSVSTQSSVQKDLQSPSENLCLSEKIEQQSTIDDSYIGCNEEDTRTDFEVRPNISPSKAFSTEKANQPSTVSPEILSEDARSVDEQKSQEAQTNMSGNLFELGEKLQSKSTDILYSPDKKLRKSETDDSKNTDKSVGENIKDDPRQTPFLDSCTSDTTPITSSIEPETTEDIASVFRRCWRQMNELKGQSFYCLKNSRCCKQFVQGALCYVFWFLFSMVCIVLIVRLENKDGPACILAVTIWCSAVTLILERGYFTYWLDQKAMQESIIEGDINGPTWHYFCLCCEEDDALLEQRQSQYTRRSRENNTVFVCEVSDISSINPSDCPQMKTVEQTGEDSPSSDHCPARSKLVKAIVHHSDMEVEENTSISECNCQGACACPKQYKKKVASTTPRHSNKKYFLVDESDIQVETNDELSRKQNWKRKDIAPRRSSHNNAFRCDCHGEDVACACADTVLKSPLHSTNREDLSAPKKIAQKGEVEWYIPQLSSNSDDAFYGPGTSARPKQHRKKATKVSSKHPKKGEKLLFIGDQDGEDWTSD